MEKRTTGIFFILLSLLVWLTDRLTHSISTILGKIICGGRYKQTADGMIVDPSCGFNIDMHFTFSLIVVFIFGILLYISSVRETMQVKIL